ncbi:hypothetical protein PIB30_057181 [Stylosanthes scabra]|uniref:Aminotransferase-like plant mobile domain-containing protein n=1 Tax=Stylosanthes scabra TaxID=79078 RepID=A0ABU6QKB7_9FABA|nr:hypothetical protein [Stylosanthes scabra]
MGVHAKKLVNHMKMDGQNLDAHFLFQYIQSHIDDDKGLTMYALAIYGLVLFPRVRGQIDGQVIKLFEQPWVPLTGPWGATSYAPALVRRQMGSLQFIPMTHGLSDMEFTYGCPNIVCKVKEIITDWKDVRYVKSGVPTSDTTPGYPLWQANRGKWFKAPVVTGPELPVHMFDDPIDYKAELEYRYENAFRWLRVDNDLISLLESENVKLQKNVEQFAATNEKWSEMYTKMEQGTTMLLKDIRDVTCHARKKAKIVEEAEAMLPPSKTQKMLSELAKELNHIGRFY